MTDKQQVLERARSEFDHWEQLLTGLSESQILDDWIVGYSLADSLINSAEHHREHREILLDWLADRS